MWLELGRVLGAGGRLGCWCAASLVVGRLCWVRFRAKERVGPKGAVAPPWGGGRAVDILHISVVDGPECCKAAVSSRLCARSPTDGLRDMDRLKKSGHHHDLTMMERAVPPSKRVDAVVAAPSLRVVAFRPGRGRFGRADAASDALNVCHCDERRRDLRHRLIPGRDHHGRRLPKRDRHDQRTKWLLRTRDRG